MSYTRFAQQSDVCEISRDGASATVVVHCDIGDAHDAALEYVGGYRLAGGGLVYFTPATYERSNVFLYCNKCVVKCLEGTSDQAGDFSTAELTLTFGPLERKNQEDEKLGDITFDIGNQEIKIKRTKVKDGDDGNAEIVDVEDFTKIIPLIQCTVSINQSVDLDPADWASISGYINSTTFRGFGVETVMFNNVTTKTTKTADGNDQTSAEYHFTIKPSGWNKYWHVPSASWHTVNPKLYSQTANFNQLFA